MKENIRTLIRWYSGRPMDITQEDLENDLLDSIMEQVGIEMGKELGKLGGNATAARYGKGYYSRIAKGWPKGKKRKPE